MTNHFRRLSYNCNHKDLVLRLFYLNAGLTDNIKLSIDGENGYAQ